MQCGGKPTWLAVYKSGAPKKGIPLLSPSPLHLPLEGSGMANMVGRGRAEGRGTSVHNKYSSIPLVGVDTVHTWEDQTPPSPSALFILRPLILPFLSPPPGILGPAHCPGVARFRGQGLSKRERSLPIAAAQLPPVFVLAALGVIHLVDPETLFEVLGSDLGVHNLLHHGAWEPASFLVMKALPKNPTYGVGRKMARAKGKKKQRTFNESQGNLGQKEVQRDIL